jgi:hypothetical protein
VVVLLSIAALAWLKVAAA